MKGTPWEKWFAGDWKRDACVQKCSLAAKGAWLEMLNSMFSEGSDHITGTIADIGRLIGASESETIEAIREIEKNEVATVTPTVTRHGPSHENPEIITLTSRRRKRELSQRTSAACRAKRYRVTQESRKSNALVTGERLDVRSQKSENRGTKAKASCDSSESAQETKKANSPSLVGHKGKVIRGEALEGFNRFWEAFGYKCGRAQAVSSWHEVYKNRGTSWESDLEQIIAGAYRAASERKDILDRGSTPMMAQGWLTARRWEDGPAPTQGPPRDKGVVFHPPVAIGPVRRPDFSRFDKEKDGMP